MAEILKLAEVVMAGVGQSRGARETEELEKTLGGEVGDFSGNENSSHGGTGDTEEELGTGRFGPKVPSPSGEGWGEGGFHLQGCR